MKVQKEANRFFIMDNDNLVGEITFVEKDNYLIANHTFVNPKYRGKGIAQVLLDSLVKYARENQKKIDTVCTYVQKKFQDSNRYDDLKLK